MTYKQTKTEDDRAFHMRHINRILYPENVTDPKIKIDFSNELSQNQRTVLIRWFEEKTINKEMNLGSIKNKLYFLRNLGVGIKKDWKDFTEDDLKDFLKKTELDGSPESSLFIYKCFLRQFFQWIYNMEDRQYPKVVDWIKIKRSNKRRLKEDTITEEEFTKMLKFAGSQRDKTILMLIKDSGCRIGEIIGLKLNDLIFDDFGICIKVNGKTGERKVRLIDCVSDLQLWLNNHPFQDNTNAPLFFQYSTNRYGRPLEWTGFSGVIRNIAKRAGVNRRIHAHLFRHTDATEKSQYMTDSELRVRYGWAPGSNMTAIYTHLTDENFD